MSIPFATPDDRDDEEDTSSSRPVLVADSAEALREVAERILEQWDERSAGWMAQKAEVAEGLDRIIRLVEEARSGDREASAALRVIPEEVPRPTLEYRLCETIQGQVLKDWREAVARNISTNPRPTLEILAILDEYRSRLRAEGSDELAARLTEPDAFELLVEMAHDLRSPLNSVLFLSEVLRSGHSGPVNDHQTRQLGLMYSASLGMISVVNDLVDLANERRNLAEEEPEPFSIGSVFDSVQRMVGPMAEEKEVELKFTLPDYDRCLGHPSPLGRVLLNLTTNALKFTDEGWVHVSARKKGRSIVEFSVQDTGKGIDPEEIERLFQPFRRSRNRTGHFFSGSGLGLSIVKRLLAQLDSELKVDAVPDGGSRFHFRVKLPSVSSI
jgi:two-component system, sensor histidine kinase and response regulator